MQGILGRAIVQRLQEALCSGYWGGHTNEERRGAPTARAF